MLTNSVNLKNKFWWIDVFSISGGELFDRVVDDESDLTEGDCIDFLSQICEGIRHMHSHYIAHLDLKVNLILLIMKLKPGYAFWCANTKYI